MLHEQVIVWKFLNKCCLIEGERAHMVRSITCRPCADLVQDTMWQHSYTGSSVLSLCVQLYIIAKTPGLCCPAAVMLTVQRSQCILVPVCDMSLMHKARLQSSTVAANWSEHELTWSESWQEC